MRVPLPRRLRAVLAPPLRRARGALRRVRRRSARGAGGVGDYRYVFVVTYGRSGSTLLTGLLNAIPGYRIRGENYNALYRLYQADAAIGLAHKRFTGPDHLTPTSSWYGAPRARPHRFRAGLVACFVAEVLRPEPGDRVLGFKEIRHTPVHMADLDRYLAFLREAFPACRIIFNHRDPAAVAASAWWTRVPDAEAKVRAADDLLWTFPADGRHFHFRYGAGGSAQVRALFRFLGEEYDEAAVRRVLDRPHGPYVRQHR